MTEEEPLLEIPEAKQPKQENKAAPYVSISLEGLRDALFSELNLLRAGEITVSRARVTSQLARRIIETATIDLCAQNLIGSGDAKEIKRLMGNNVQS